MQDSAVTMKLRVDSRRLDIAMAAAGVRTDNALADLADITDRTIRNIRTVETCSMQVLERIAAALGCNPIDLLTTPGFPDPKLGALAALSA